MRKFFIPLTSLLFLLPFTSQAQDLTEKGGFSTGPDEEHYFLFVLANRPNDLSELRGEITKYIWKNHPSSKLKITQIQVDGELAEVPLIHVATFASKAEAMAFYNKIKQNKPDFLQMGLTKDYFPLSKTNYEKVLLSKSLKGYRPFFELNY